MSIHTRITELNELPVAKIRATLTLEDYSVKDITEALKEAGLSTKKIAFTETYYAWLEVEQRTEADAKDYILGEGEFGETSANVQNHVNHYLKIHGLSATIWESKEA